MMSSNQNFLTENQDLLKKEAFRLQTFGNWPTSCPLQPAEFAQMGFYYTGSDDEAQCVFCKTKLKDWKSGDSILSTHLKKFPRCKFLMGKDVGNIPIPKASSSNLEQNPDLESEASNEPDSEESDDIHAQYPGYISLKSRITSFKNWPNGKYSNTKLLAASGLFYTGNDDKVKCFYCGGGFCNWFSSDDPVKIHKNAFSSCAFIQQYSIDEAQQAAREAKNKETSKESAEMIDPNILMKKIDNQAEELDDLMQQVTCDICMDAKIDTILLPCGHVFCRKCSEKLERCGKCRKLILEIQQIFS